MAAGQLLLDRSGDAADPYMTLVGYFSATRELAGMARYMGDDVQTALAKGRPWSRLPRRTGTDTASSTSPSSPPASRARTSPRRWTRWRSRSTRSSTRPRGSGTGCAARRRASRCPNARARPVRRGPRHLDAAGRRRRDPARPDARRRPAEEHRRVHPGVLAGRPGRRPARPGGRARQLGAAAGPRALRAVPALPRDVLRRRSRRCR